MRSSISFQNILTNVIVTQGIVGAMVNKNINFINMLGGNSISVSCYNYNEFLDFYYDGAAPYLYAIDKAGNFIVYSIKLSLSKQHSNECFRKILIILTLFINKITSITCYKSFTYSFFIHLSFIYL